VAKAAMDSASRRADRRFRRLRRAAGRFVFRSGLVMKPVFAKAKASRKRVIYAEGEDERVLRAVQVVLDDAHRAAQSERAS
jgi:malate dehydrogenase (oxaloacetate-decarboxylating)(NADP+)